MRSETFLTELALLAPLASGTYLTQGNLICLFYSITHELAGVNADVPNSWEVLDITFIFCIEHA